MKISFYGELYPDVVHGVSMANRLNIGFLGELYWSLKPIYTNHWFYNIYYLSLGLSFFVLRGDLMASFAYTFTILGSYVFFLFFLKTIFRI